MIIALQTLIFFRQSLLTALNRLFSPYYKRLSFTFSRYSPDDEDDEEDVFAEFDEEKGVVFFPPMYVQRYAAVSDCLIDERWHGKLEKVVDLGYHDMSFIKYLKEVPGIRWILGVDIESIPLRCSSELLGCDEYGPKRENSLQVTLFQGNAADPDYRLIGSDAVIAIEMIEHMLPHDLDRLVHTIFGFIKPWIAIITTPNADFNVLFKSLEKNGLRRWDHFFEWTREQFHDWCSNIVTRYPQFTVTCQGIGPGPPDTQHLGCCSQLALFINKNYMKQQELNPNSLAIVSNVPSPYSMAEMISGWESPINDPQNMLMPKDNGDRSLSDFLYSDKQSCVTILIASSPEFSFTTLEYSDKTSQCNLDTEIGKSFLMFNDEEMCFSIRKPRRLLDGRVYEIEDVFSRLNCTTFQVTKFSKTTQNLMAKNRVDSLVHTREVVNEITHLTKMLSFNRDEGDNSHIWSNINWGENAPYWNQYYKIVREYNYPFEMKSDECRILDLISDEINRLIDAQCDDEFCTDMNKLEIPIEHLMRVVRHLTNDVEKVKDLLVWNGYELSGDVVIHSRIVVDNTSLASCDGDWPENDTVSDLDTTDVATTILSEGSNIAPDYHGRCLRRALDKKVRALRLMMSVDEDITAELDRVVCRLMKLALRTSRGKQTAPPTKWMQCKLLDLLTLTEKSISRRRRQNIESFPLKAIVDGIDKKKQFLILDRIEQEDHKTNRMVDKYNNLLEAVEKRQHYNPYGFGFEDDMGDQDGSSDYLREFDINDLAYSHQPKTLVGVMDKKLNKNRTQAWVDEDNLEVVPYPNHNEKSPTIIISDHSTSYGEWKKYKKLRKQGAKIEGDDKKTYKRSFSKITAEKPRLEDKRNKKSKTTVVKKSMRNMSTSFTGISKIHSKKVANEFGNHTLKPKKSKNENKKVRSSLLALCRPETKTQSSGKEFDYITTDKKDKEAVKSKPRNAVSAPEESKLIDIIMDGVAETIALSRSIGTDAEMEPSTYEEELVIGNVTNIAKDDSFYSKLQMTSENVQSQTIFLYDINEPSTSKGVRHISMDVQCGTDLLTPAYGLLTPPASVTRMPKIFNNGIRIGDSLTNMLSKRNSLDFGSPVNNNIQNFGPVHSRIRSPIFAKGIKIEDSLDNLVVNKKGHDVCAATSTIDQDDGRAKSPTMRAPKIRIKDSLSEVRAKKGLDFGMSTNENGLKIMKNSSAMTETVRKSVPKTRSPTSRSPTSRLAAMNAKGVKSEFHEGKYLNISTETNESSEESPNISVDVDANNSLTHVLNNFEASINMHRQPYRSTSPTNRHIKSAHIARNKKKDLTNDQKLLNKKKHSDSVNTTDNDDKNIRSKSPTIFMDDNMMSYIVATSEEPNSDFGASLTEATEVCGIESPGARSPVIFTSKLLTSDGSTCTHLKENRQNKVNVIINDSFSKTVPQNDNFIFGSNDTDTESRVTYFIGKRHKSAMYDSANNLSKPLPGLRNFGFKVKTSKANIIKKVEFATTSVKLLSGCRSLKSPTEESLAETECLKSASSPMKTEDSCSDFCGTNYCSSQKSSLHVTNSFSNTSQVSREKEKLILTKAMGPKLSCGGIHIHSYKEKQRTEDIVFQGEWQRQSPKQQRNISSPARKVPEVSKKSNNKKVIPKDRNQTGKPEKKYEVKIEKIKPMHVRNTKPIKLNKDIINKTEQLRKVTLPSIAKAIKANNKNVIKVASKIGMSSISSKNSRNIRTVKRPINVIQTSVKRDCDIKKDSDRRKDLLRKNYLPPYLKKKMFGLERSNLNQSLDSVNTMVISKDIINDDLFRSNTVDIKSDLMQVPNEARDDISYIVFRNELEDSSTNANKKQTESPENGNKVGNASRKRSLHKRSSSPISHNSSTCSTSQSVATVKTVSTWSKGSRRHSTSSNKSSIGNTDSETAPPSRTRKFSKRSKTQKKSDDQDKENVPESSKKCRSDKANVLNVKNTFKNRKNVFVTQFATDSGLALNTKPTTKSNIRIPAIGSNEDLIKRPKSAVMSKKKSLQSNDSSYTEEIKKQDSLISEASNRVLLLDPHKKVQKSISGPLSPEGSTQIIKVVDSCLLTEWLESGHMSAVHRASTENAILEAMRQLVEERVDLIGSLASDSRIIDSANTSLEESREFDDNSSLKSFKTVVHRNDTDFNVKMKNEIDNMNNIIETFSLGNETATPEADLLSFKSVTSTSRYSEYFSADNEQNNIEEPVKQTQYVNSVRDIFERKDLTLNQTQVGPFAVQAFSGFSMNVEPVSGDQPDYVNLIDSETGSIALDTRQATSEELFVSGRSSESYESCLIDEDAVVPNWLFHINSQQQSIDEDENRQELIPLPLPLVEPGFDMNGNVMEPGVGLGAGAGDGRGMHSDHSQDSSGRGSSLSSSDTSSGQHSEAILLDPSAFTGQFELVRETIGSSMAVTTLVMPVGSPDNRQGGNELSTSRDPARITANLLHTTSDGDADVSSLDTDLLDSSDN